MYLSINIHNKNSRSVGIQLKILRENNVYIGLQKSLKSSLLSKATIKDPNRTSSHIRL